MTQQSSIERIDEMWLQLQVPDTSIQQASESQLLVVENNIILEQDEVLILNKHRRQVGRSIEGVVSTGTGLGINGDVKIQGSLETKSSVKPL